MFNDTKMKKKSVAKLLHGDLFKIYVDPKRIYVDTSIQAHSSNVTWYIWQKFCMGYKWDLSVD